MAASEREIVLIPGSKYRVKSIESREKPLISHGVFRGYAVVGPDEAIVIELDESYKDYAGHNRLIPCHMIVSIDVIEEATGPEKREDVERMYG